MGDTYTQILIQYVFAVQNRNSIITESNKNSIEKYITGIITQHRHKMLAIYCMPDHCHILVGLHPAQSISELAREIKSSSSKWINDNKLFQVHFSWQEGYGAFSYGKSQLDVVVRYILNQPEHHRKKSFKEEYLAFLMKFRVPYNEKYLFDWIN